MRTHKRMKPDAYIAFDWPKFQGDTHGLAREHKWSYWTAICAYYWAGCIGLEDTDDFLRRACECEMNNWAITKATVFRPPFFELRGDGKWHQKRAEREYLRAKELMEKKSNQTQTARDAWLAKCKSTEEVTNLVTDSATSRPTPTPTPLHTEEPTLHIPFESFWKAYPRKVGKLAAQKAWQKVTVPLVIVLKAVESQKKSQAWIKDNGQFIPHPATWLNQGRWMDEVSKPKEIRAGGNF